MNFTPFFFNKDFFYQFVKSSELVMVYIYLFMSLINGSTKSLFMSILIIMSAYFNYFLKHVIATPLFEMFGDYLPIIGQGPRPEGAADCGFFKNCPAKPSTSFGFPSGHSQFAGINSGFLIRDILEKKTKDGKFSSLSSTDKFSVIFLLVLVFIMMYARVYVEKCHTIEQTLFGALIGLILGYKSYDLYTYINSKFNNILNMDSVWKRIIISVVFFYISS